VIKRLKGLLILSVLIHTRAREPPSFPLSSTHLLSVVAVVVAVDRRVSRWHLRPTIFEQVRHSFSSINHAVIVPQCGGMACNKPSSSQAVLPMKGNDNVGVEPRVLKINRKH